MKPLNCRSVLIALASFLWASACMADELTVVINSAGLVHDKRTGEPRLELVVADAFKERLHIFSHENVGQKLEVRADGRMVLSTVIREPLFAARFEISDRNWTDQAVIELARQLAEAPKGEIELRTSSSN